MASAASVLFATGAAAQEATQDSDEIVVLAALAELAAEPAAETPGDPHSPWNARDQWWPNATRVRTMEMEFADGVRTAEVRRDGDRWTLRLRDMDGKEQAGCGLAGRAVDPEGAAPRGIASLAPSRIRERI